jgi:hypothetical protein
MNVPVAAGHPATFGSVSHSTDKCRWFGSLEASEDLSNRKPPVGGTTPASHMEMEAAQNGVPNSECCQALDRPCSL